MQSDSVAFSQALTQYLSTLNLASAPDTLNELAKFIRWCGRERNVMDLTPQEAASWFNIPTTFEPRDCSAFFAFFIVLEPIITLNPDFNSLEARPDPRSPVPPKIEICFSLSNNF